MTKTRSRRASGRRTGLAARGLLDDLVDVAMPTASGTTSAISPATVAVAAPSLVFQSPVPPPLSPSFVNALQTGLPGRLSVAGVVSVGYTQLGGWPAACLLLGQKALAYLFHLFPLDLIVTHGLTMNKLFSTRQQQ